MCILGYSAKVERKERTQGEKKRSQAWMFCLCVRVCMRVRVCVCDNAHCNSIYALLHLYVTTPFLFFVFLFVFSFVFNYIFSFTLLSRHILRWNGPSVFFCPSSFPSTQHPTSYHRPSSNRTNVKSGVSALSSTSTAFGTAASNARLDQTGNGHIDEALRQQALAEEEAAMNQYKVLARDRHVDCDLRIEFRSSNCSHADLRDGRFSTFGTRDDPPAAERGSCKRRREVFRRHWTFSDGSSFQLKLGVPKALKRQKRVQPN